ncbi:GNAT family N-acetyltransferase [Conexibacter arvalis]|uniref:RimJ/RimL family protein N-acetyltransferase n=1 Tax=Conexibacter arvalis TaxID=912552 RepID=A0A840IE88_9ACTN|nr:GNAT family protein [Conexibacter arvalis]MBB4663112.1 RimJ/RimL family protein N-acetyltransferase [Conexibacter arvalis]
MLDSALLPLANSRVRLRALRLDDATAFAEGTDDPDVRAYGHLPESEYTPESVKTMIERDARPGLERGDLAVLAIADADTDQFTGSLVLFDVTEPSAEVGFWLHPRHRGSGMAAAALDLAARFARDSGLTRLTARTTEDNVASQNVLARADFARTGAGSDIAPSGARIRLLHYARSIDTVS